MARLDGTHETTPQKLGHVSGKGSGSMGQKLYAWMAKNLQGQTRG